MGFPSACPAQCYITLVLSLLSRSCSVAPHCLEESALWAGEPASITWPQVTFLISSATLSRLHWYHSWSLTDFLELYTHFHNTVSVYGLTRTAFSPFLKLQNSHSSLAFLVNPPFQGGINSFLVLSVSLLFSHPFSTQEHQNNSCV